MQIIGIRQQFIADHSSTNYYFYAAKPLSAAAQAHVNTLSSHVDVNDQTAEITYNGDFADLGEERRKKFLTYYDVEVRESYDWWTLSVMLVPAELPKINFKEFEVENEASLTFTKQNQRLCLCFDGWHLNYSAAYGEFREDEVKGLAKLGLKIRAELNAGKTDALAVMREYCREGQILKHPKSPAAKTLASLLEVV